MTSGSDPGDLVARLARGDRQAFEGLFRQYNPGMLRFAGAILGSRAQAEEVVQDAWLAILTGIADYQGRGTLAAWMFTILRNKARTRAAREGRSVSLDTGPGGSMEDGAAFDTAGQWRHLPALWTDITPERITGDRELLDRVNRAIDSLPAAQRAVLTLKVMHDVATPEICRILDLTEANMRVLLHRARHGLRRKLDGDIGGM